jgi:flagellar hook-associated protein 1 FlgK
VGGSITDVVAQKLIRSGEIAAALELRDKTLVEAQRQLDELAAGMSRALSDRQAPVVAAANGAQTGFQLDFAGWQPGNAITIDYRGNGAAAAGRRIILVPTSGTAPMTIPPGDTADPNATIIRVDMSGGFAAAAAAIQTALNTRGISLTVDSPAGNTFRFLDDGAAGTTDVTTVSAGITVTGLTDGRPELPLFVDAGYSGTPFTGSFEGRSHLTGLAQRLAVNQGLLTDPAKLVVFNTSPATPQGDATRPRHLIDSLTSAARVFSGASAIDGLSAPYVSTVAGFAQRVVETQGARAEFALRLDEGQSVALANIESKFAETSGVNIDEEMSHLVQLQTAYGANARVMTALRDMLDMLLRI